MKHDVRPHLFIRCEDEAVNCHRIEEVRWSLVDPNSSAKPVLICHENSDANEELKWDTSIQSRSQN